MFASEEEVGCGCCFFDWDFVRCFSLSVLFFFLFFPLRSIALPCFALISLDLTSSDVGFSNK